MFRWSTLLFLFCLISDLEARGGSGGARGSSGARSSSSFSSSRGTSSSSYSKPTYTSGSSNYRSGSTTYNSNFRQNVFHSTSTTTTFVYSPMTHSHVIISPITPIYFGSYHYYWGGHYVSDYQRPKRCEYEISDDDQELRNVTFSNGTKPTTLSFGCKANEECCGMECCSTSTVWVWIVGIIICVLLLVWMCSCCKKYGYCDADPVSTSVPVITTTTTTTHSYSVPSAPPPPPGFQQFGPPPDQPVYGMPPQYNTYEPHSPYGGRPLSSSQVTMKK